MARIFFGDKKNQSTSRLPYNVGGIYTPSSAPIGTFNPTTTNEVFKSGNELLDFLRNQDREGSLLKRNYAQDSRNDLNEQNRKIAGNSRNLGYQEDTSKYNLGQLGINFERSIEDLSTAKIRGQQDYDRTLTNMQHEYGSKAEQQSQNSIQQGTDEAGTNTASAAVRGANQAFDKGNVDLSHARNEEDLAQQGERDTQNYGTQKARDEETIGQAREATGIQNQETATAGRQHRNSNVTKLGELLHTAAIKGSQATAKQAEYEQHAGESSIYEAHTVHPKLVLPQTPYSTAAFPGGTHPNSPATGPHLYGSASGPGLYGSVKAPSPARYGTNVGGGKRLAAPRY